MNDVDLSSKRVEVSAIKEVFDLTQICGNEESLKRWTIAPDVNRPGLELAGYKKGAELKRVVIIGNKEYGYIQTLDYETQKDRFGFLTDVYTPCIIITAGHKTPDALKEVANYKNFPVFEFSGPTWQLTSDLTVYLTTSLAPTDSIYGGLMNIYGTGVVILGDSGIGKSELSLDLIKRGHIFIADDLIDVSEINRELIGEAPNNLKKMLEVRGIGVVDVCALFGGHCFSNKSRIDFAIKLVKHDAYRKTNPNRLNPLENSMKVLGVKIPLLEIPITEGKSMSTIVETAVANYILKKQGIDSNELFKQRIMQEIIQKG